jgi:hypothetical protein
VNHNRSCAEDLVHLQTALPELDLDAASLHNMAGYKPAGNVRPAMQDVAMLLFTVVFFAVAFLYVKACQKLR